MADDTENTTTTSTTDQTINDQVAAAALAVTTDQADYAPGSIATFTATGVGVGGSVTFDVDHVLAGDDGIIGTEDDTRADDLSGTGPFTVTDGGEGDLDGEANGTIVTTWAVNADAANQAFVLTATDESGATATAAFTDAAPPPDPTGAAAILTTANSTATVNGGVIVQETTAKGTGTGNINAFLRIQEKDTEQGYNTNGDFQFDEKEAVNFTHAIQLKDIPIVFIGTTAYREIFLDLGESGGNSSFLSLDDLQILSASSDSLENFDPTAGAFLDAGNDAVPLYNLNGWLALNDLQAGNGAYNYKFLVPNSLFSGVDASANIYLYAKFGAQGNGWEVDSTFEEFAVRETAPNITILKDAIVLDSSDPTDTDDNNAVDSADDFIKYTVTIRNNGDTALTGVQVTDVFEGGPIKTLKADLDDLTATLVESGAGTHGNNILEVGEIWTYTYIHDVTQAEFDAAKNGDGTLDNIATVDTDQTGPKSDPASVPVETPDQGQAHLVLTKTTQDTTEDPTAGVAAHDAGYILVDHTIKWTYAVTNDGTAGVTLVTVTDNNGTDDDEDDDFNATAVLGMDGFNTGDVANKGVLDVGETWLFEATGVAKEGVYVNLAQASGTEETENGPGDVVKSEVADSTYTGAAPAIQIVKTIQDLADPEGLPDDGNFILVGESIQWIFEVTNAGNVALTNVQVSDDVLGDIDANVNTVLTKTGGNQDDFLEDGETWTYTLAGTALVGEHKDTGTAYGDFTDTAGHTETVDDDDGSSYFGADPKIDVEKYVSVDGGNTWLDADSAPGPVLTDAANISPMFKFVVHNTGNVELTDILLDDDVFDLSGLDNGTTLTASGNNIVISSLAADDGDNTGPNFGPDTIELVITAPWAAGQHTNTAFVSATYEDTAGHDKEVKDHDAANYLGFDVGVHALTQGFWGQHQEAWDAAIAYKKGAADTQNLVTSGVLTSADIFYTKTIVNNAPVYTKIAGVDSDNDGSINAGVYGILLGDADGDFKTDVGIENTLFVDLVSARQIIMSSDSTNDTRQILMKQALAAQLNIYNGVNDPLDLVGEAVTWLKGQAPYASPNYTDGSTGRVDTNQNGILEATEYNNATSGTNAKSFLGDANSIATGVQKLTSNMNAWQTNVDVFNFNDGDAGTTTDVVMANGEDLKNALEFFNKDMLMVSADGDYVGWSTNQGNTVSFVHDNNTIDNFWLTLKDAGVL